jgi:RNA polymerase sigma-70 factor, ECF subfamily
VSWAGRPPDGPTQPQAADRRVNAVEFCAVTAEPTVEVDDSLQLLFRAHYGRLVRALTLVAGDREVAADAVQEAFVKAHLRWWRLKRYDDPIGWIRRVAINRLRDVHRSRAREQRALARLAARQRGDQPAVDEHRLAGEARMAELLAALPKQQRLAVTLFYVAELTVAEVADAMRVSEGTVKFHLHRGRERLRLTMPDDEPEARRGA